MKQADRLNAKYTIVIGDQELDNNKIDVKKKCLQVKQNNSIR